MGHKPKKRYTRPTDAELWRFKNSLGPLRHQFHDDEIRRLYAEMHQMAKLLLDIYRYRHNQPIESDDQEL